MVCVNDDVIVDTNINFIFCADRATVFSINIMLLKDKLPSENKATLLRLLKFLKLVKLKNKYSWEEIAFW